MLLWFIVCIGLHDQIQLCHTVASFPQLLSLLSSPPGPKSVTEERLKARAPTKIFESVSSKKKSLGALGDSVSRRKKKKERFILAFCHGFNLSYFRELGPSGSVADGAGQSCPDNKR